MPVTYEWDIEDVDREGGDILDHHHEAELARLPELNADQQLVLVRDVGNDVEGLTSRAWAYVVDGKLPSHFADAGGCPVASVPARFHKELARRGFRSIPNPYHEEE